jgi:DNA-directed RNA polymerase specialized sigma24 family protein
LEKARKGHEQADAALSLTLLSAAVEGWSMRELSEATGLALSNVCRRINAAERSAA